jgi:hypothetical protein
MSDIIVEIMVEVLTILAIATKEVKRGRISELMWWCIFTILADRLFRKVLEKVDGKQRNRGQLGEVGQIDTRRGTDGICGAAEDDSHRR